MPVYNTFFFTCSIEYCASSVHGGTEDEIQYEEVVEEGQVRMAGHRKQILFITELVCGADNCIYEGEGN